MEPITVLRHHMLYLGRKEAELTWHGTLKVFTNEENKLTPVQPQNLSRVGRNQAGWARND